MQRAYLEGLENDENVPLEFRYGEDGDIPVTRRVADAGTDVIDLNEMREQLEADREKRKGGA